jgi:hypothetical protein
MTNGRALKGNPGIEPKPGDLLRGMRIFLAFPIVRHSNKTLENTTFLKLDLFSSSGEAGDTYSVWSLRNS